MLLYGHEYGLMNLTYPSIRRMTWYILYISYIICMVDFS